MTSAVFYDDSGKVVGVMDAAPDKLKAAQYGFFGQDATSFARLARQFGAELDFLLRSTPKTSEADAMKRLAEPDGRPFVVVDKLPSADHTDGWVVKGGRLSLAKAA